MSAGARAGWLLAMLGLAPLWTPAAAGTPQWEGALRLLVDLRRANTDSALAPAAELLGAGRDCLLGEARGRVSHLGFSAAAQANVSGCAPGGQQRDARLDELFWDGGSGPWRATLGKKVLAWDVAYGFRPLDVVQREARRALIETQLEGVPLALLEHFGESSSISLIAANPGRSASASGRDEQALLVRAFTQLGSADAYGLARWGAQERASLGAGLAWVASEALEVHASARWGQSATRLVSNAAAVGATTEPTAGPGSRQSPWMEHSSGAFWQAVLGGQWTGHSKASLLAEVWYDGTAPADSAWDSWRQRNADLGARALASSPAVAGALAWQAQALSRANLRRLSTLLRLAYAGESWQPALDLLCHPADGGVAASATLSWQGEALRIEAGLRGFFGPPQALLRQLPDRAIGYAAATLAF